MYTELIIELISLIGISAFSVSGAFTAIRSETDLFGTVAVGTITATGGGIMRDILLGVCPPKSFINCSYIFLAAAISLIVYMAAFFMKDTFFSYLDLTDRINNIFDALGLGVFVSSGTMGAIEYGYMQNAFLCILIGTLTGIGGGVLRDILVDTVPVCFKKHIYALAAISGSCTFYLLHSLSVCYTLCVVIASAVTFFLRMAATHFKWNLPTIY